MTAIVLCAALLAGIAGGLLAPPDSVGLGMVAAASGAACWLGWRLPMARWLALVALVCSLGALRVGLVSTPAHEALARFEGQRLEVVGRVAAVSERSGRLASAHVDVFEAHQATTAPTLFSESAGGLPRIELRGVHEAGTSPPRTGDWVTAEGRLTSAFSAGGLARAEVLRRQGITRVMTLPRVGVLERAPEQADPARLAAELRSTIRRGFSAHLPEPQASLAFGMLLGGSGDLDSTLRGQLQAAGLGHLVAVSGFNVVIVAGAAGWLTSRLVGRRLALAPVVVVLVAYTLLVGAPPSAVRAAIMAGAAVLALRVGRIADPLTSVVLAATVMALVQPHVLLDLGFQLSLAATLGLILLYPRLRSWLAATGLPRVIVEPLGLALAAEVATLPFVVSVFHLVSVVAPVANVLAAPLVPLSMLGGALLAASLPLGPVASVAAWFAWVPATLLAELARLAGSLPFATFSTGALPPLSAAFLAAMLLVAGLVPLPEVRGALEKAFSLAAAVIRVDRRALGASLAAVSAAIGLAAGLLWARPDGLLHLSVLPTRSPGQVVLLRSPSGGTVLVSGSGADPREMASLLADQLAVWERSLGAIVVLDPRHEAGIEEIVRRYPAGAIIRAAEGSARLDLGAGATLDVEVGEASLELGALRLALPRDLPRPQQGGVVELVSDGVEVWPK